MVIVILLSIITILGLFLIKSYKEYFKNNWSSLFWTVIVTFLGVFLAFYVENFRQEQIEKEIFTSKLVALLIETERNVFTIGDIRNNIAKKEVNTQKLNSDIAKQVLSDPLVIKYGDTLFWITLTQLVDTIEEFNTNNKPINEVEYRIRNMEEILFFYSKKFKISVNRDPNLCRTLERISYPGVDYKEKLKKIKLEKNRNYSK